MAARPTRDARGVATIAANTPEVQYYWCRDDNEYGMLTQTMMHYGWIVIHHQRNWDGTISSTWQRAFIPQPASPFEPREKGASAGQWIGFIAYGIGRLIVLVIANIVVATVIGAIIGVFVRHALIRGLLDGGRTGAIVGLYIAAVSFGIGLLSAILRALRGDYRRR